MPTATVDVRSPRDPAPLEDHSEIEISSATSVSTCTIAIRGEVDSLTAPRLRLELLDVLRRPDLPGDVLIDLSQVGFLGAAGIAVLAIARQTAVGDGRTVRLRCGSNRAVIRPMQITGLWTTLDTAEG